MSGLNSVANHCKMGNIKIYHHYFKQNATLRNYVQIFLNMKHISVFFFSSQKHHCNTSYVTEWTRFLWIAKRQKACDYLVFFFLKFPFYLYSPLPAEENWVFQKKNGFRNLFSWLVPKYVFLSLFSNTLHFLIDQITSLKWCKKSNWRRDKELD